MAEWSRKFTAQITKTKGFVSVDKTFNGDAYAKVEDLICAYERANLSSYVIARCTKDFKKTDFTNLPTRIYWEECSGGIKIPFDGVPFVILGTQLRECCHGPDRHKAKKQRAKIGSKLDHEYGKKKRMIIQTTKKQDCHASIKLRAVVRFPDFDIPGDSEWGRRKASKALKDSLKIEGLNMEQRIYIQFPDECDHAGHSTDEVELLSQRVDRQIIRQIHRLVQEGVRSVAEMKRHINVYNKANFPEIPLCSNRYYPTNKDIRNHMYRALRDAQFSTEDQENLSQHVNKWKLENPDDMFFYQAWYIQNNVKSLGTYRKYADEVPMFLRNRPRKFINHCLKRLSPIQETIPSQNIVHVRDKYFHVTSVDTGNMYTVNLAESIPNCTCKDWELSHWPCKHMLAILTSVPNFSWDTLHSNYKNCAHFNVDTTFINSNDVTESSVCTQPGPLFSDKNKTMPKASVANSTPNVPAVASRCKALASSVKNLLYLVNKREHYTELYSDLQQLHGKLLNMIPTQAGLPLRKVKFGRKDKPAIYGQLKLRRKKRKRLGVHTSMKGKYLCYLINHSFQQ